MKVLQCPHFATLDGMNKFCLKGNFPINCETCISKDKYYVEVVTKTTGGDQIWI